MKQSVILNRCMGKEKKCYIQVSVILNERPLGRVKDLVAPSVIEL